MTSTRRIRPVRVQRRAAPMAPLVLGLVAALALGCATRPVAETASEHATPVESRFYTGAHPLTLAGRRSGEGYFDASGRELVFQSEREPGNPFYQIYRMDLETGETRRVSPGVGKTTCGWIHPDGVRTLFSSTHLGPESEARQAEELEARRKGETRRYSWDYDPAYDLFVAEADATFSPLTPAWGYDAEGSFSPDGRYVAFASNRHAFAEALAPAERERLAENPQHFIDLYLLDTTTGETRRLTTSAGYDGGPFFSPDGERVVWRRFSEDGARAEIHTIRLDGTDERVLTRLGVMSWAPFYHPSGDYLVFNTNLHGYANFELYLVDAEGRADPVRVTDREGFDALASFSPDGRQLVWTSNRTPSGGSQLFRADWDDAAARRALGLPPTAADALARPVTSPAITAQDLTAHVAALTDPRTEGRRAGSPGERLAADYLARAFAAAGLRPAGDDGGFLHAFSFTAGVSLGEANALTLTRGADDPSGVGGAPDALDALDSLAPDAHATRFVLDHDWRPLAFSRTGPIAPSGVVFVGYGLVAPEAEGEPAVDDYGDLDVRDRWVVVFRDLPGGLSDARRDQLRRHTGARYKAMTARDRGARGLLFVSGPAGRFRHELAPLRFDASLAGTSVAAISLSDTAAERLLEGTGLDLATLQAAAAARVRAPAATPSAHAPPTHAHARAGLAHATQDGTHASAREAHGGASPLPLSLEGVTLAAEVDLRTERAEGVNVLGRLQLGAAPSAQTIVLGAHYDHLGRGEGSSSLADASESGQIHAGADDNASGTALLIELAEALAARQREGFELGARDFLFAAWSGEELGLLGSDAWVAAHVNPHSNAAGPVAYLNFDMVGRLREDLVIHGLGSSPAWAGLLEAAAAPVGLSIHPQQDSYVPTDATRFYQNGVPSLSAFTGVHSEYHTPRDTADLLDLEGTARIGALFLRVAEALGRAEAPPAYRTQTEPTAARGGGGGFRVFLGTIPDYARTDVVGVLLSGVAPEGPAQKAGLRRGDRIVEADGRPIENLYDYTYALEAMTVGEPVVLVIERDGERLEQEVVPGSRD